MSTPQTSWSGAAYTGRLQISAALRGSVGRVTTSYLADLRRTLRAHQCAESHTQSALGTALPGYSHSRCVIGPGFGLGAQFDRLVGCCAYLWSCSSWRVLPGYAAVAARRGGVRCGPARPRRRPGPG